METRFKVGDRVRHEMLGLGVIINSEAGSNGRDYKVDFGDDGIVWLAERVLTIFESESEIRDRLIKEMQSTPLTFIPNNPDPSRAMIAAMCLQGLLAGGGMFGVEMMAKDAVDLADALIAELAKPKP
jgi:hypothetical protein